MVPFGEICYGDLQQTTAERTWLWHGFVGPGQITMLTSPGKNGKTTLLAALLAKRKPGAEPSEPHGAAPGEASAARAPAPAATLAGRAVAPGPSAVASEEHAHVWLQRGRLLGLRADTVFFCRPFAGKPTLAQLTALCERIAELRQAGGADLAVFDALVHFLPRAAENNADLLVEALAPLRRLAEAGLAVVALHHPGKGAALPGQSARGTSALTAYVDIALELRRLAAHDQRDRRRLLTAWSRFPETPPALLLELTDDAADYRVLDLPDDDALSGSWPALRLVLEDARRQLRRLEILEEWPSDHLAPAPATLARLLEAVATRGLVRRDGAGRKSEPYRYWLPEKEAEFASDIGCQLEELQRAQLRNMPPDVRRAAETASAIWNDQDDES